MHSVAVLILHVFVVHGLAKGQINKLVDKLAGRLLGTPSVKIQPLSLYPRLASEYSIAQHSGQVVLRRPVVYSTQSGIEGSHIEAMLEEMRQHRQNQEKHTELLERILEKQTELLQRVRAGGDTKTVDKVSQAADEVSMNAGVAEARQSTLKASTDLKEAMGREDLQMLENAIREAKRFQVDAQDIENAERLAKFMQEIQHAEVVASKDLKKAMKGEDIKSLHKAIQGAKDIQVDVREIEAAELLLAKLTASNSLKEAMVGQDQKALEKAIQVAKGFQVDAQEIADAEGLAKLMQDIEDGKLLASADLKEARNGEDIEVLAEAIQAARDIQIDVQEIEAAEAHLATLKASKDLKNGVVGENIREIEKAILESVAPRTTGPWTFESIPKPLRALSYSREPVNVAITISPDHRMLNIAGDTGTGDYDLEGVFNIGQKFFTSEKTFRPHNMPVLACDNQRVFTKGTYELLMKYEGHGKSAVYIGGVLFESSGDATGSCVDWDILIRGKEQKRTPYAHGEKGIDLMTRKLSGEWRDGDSLRFVIDVDNNTLHFQKSGGPEFVFRNILQFANHKTPGRVEVRAIVASMGTALTIVE